MTGFQELKAPGALGTHGLDRLELFKHLDATLRLTGFCRFIAKALDKGREVRGLSLVGFGIGIHKALFFDALVLVVRIRPGVAENRFVFNRPGHIGCAV